METKVLEKSSRGLFTLEAVKNYLRVNTQHDDNLLNYFMNVATEWVEKKLNKSLLKQKRFVSHDNNCFKIPFGPLIEIIEVKYHKKILSPLDYTLTPKGDTVIIQAPFHWKSPKLEVTYFSGFSQDPEEVPQVLRHAVLETIRYLYKNQGNVYCLEEDSMPWLQAQIPYSLG